MIRRRSIFAFIIVVLVAALIIPALKDKLVKISVENGVQVITGLKLKMGQLNVGVFKPIVSIKNLIILNPPGYRDEMMLDMPEIYVDYDLGSIRQGRIHLREIRLHLKELLVVRNENGELNLDSLKVVKAQKAGKKPGEGDAKKAPPIIVDNLSLKIGKVVFKDYSKGPKPSINEFNMNIDEEYQDIEDAYSLVSIVVSRSLRSTAISKLVNFDASGLQSTVSKVMSGAINRTQNAMQGTADTLRQTARSIIDIKLLPEKK
ncbi:MAG: hypothetical protein WC779_04390 [Candidatus Omnitrophota bacterium]|jgi:hypothetical protein